MMSDLAIGAVIALVSFLAGAGCMLALCKMPKLSPVVIPLGVATSVGEQEQTHRDELLYRGKAGHFVPYQPAKYVAAGQSPVAAAWAMTRETQIEHHTRRIGE
jgi:hypothetical protein